MHEIAQQQIHEHGFIRFDDMMPGHRNGDLAIAQAARVSFDGDPQQLTEKEMGLVKFLMRERHGTPFEHVVFKFRIRCFQSVMIEWLRHRMSSFNAESGRYSIYKEEWYVPSEDHVRTQAGKPGAYFFTPICCTMCKGEKAIENFETGEWVNCTACDCTGLDREKIKRTQATMDAVAENAFAAYKEMLEDGVAKEIARMVLPVSQYVSFMWTVNLRSLLNFLSLRNDPNAMREIREYAAVIEEMITPFVPVTMEAFEANGRKAP